MEFMKHGRFLKLEHKIAPIHESRVDNHIFVPGAQWAYPIEQDAKKRLVKFVDAPAVPKQWAMELKEKLLKSYDFETISAQYSKIFKPVLKG
jgi:hypothetical protein